MNFIRPSEERLLPNETDRAAPTPSKLDIVPDRCPAESAEDILLSSGESPCGREESHRRKTRQRQVILEELQAVTSHPTAVELHELVRRRLPKVSLGTVYRNLDLLARMGVIEKLEHSGGEARFDANTAEHDHFALRALRPNR